MNVEWEKQKEKFDEGLYKRVRDEVYLSRLGHTHPSFGEARMLSLEVCNAYACAEMDKNEHTFRERWALRRLMKAISTLRTKEKEEKEK